MTHSLELSCVGCVGSAHLHLAIACQLITLSHGCGKVPPLLNIQRYPRFMIIKLIKLLVITTFLTACATQKDIAHQWPEGLPALAYFEEVYAQDLRNQQEQTLDEYLVWVKRYYLGWELYRRGWLDVTQDLVNQIDDPALASEVNNKMLAIGRAVAGEWAKKTNTRKIFTRHVAVWGNALVESMNRGEELKLINIVQKDVNQLLADKLSVDAIKADRYYAPDKDDVFSW